jgi:hypothetical protein
MKRLWKVWEAKSMQLAFKLGEIMAVSEVIAGAHVKMDSMESMIQSEILSEIMPIVERIKSDAAAGTSALANREVALATRQLSSELQSIRHDHHVAISSLESDLALLVGFGGLASHSPICGDLNSDFPADWELVLDFLGRHTSPGSRRQDCRLCGSLRIWPQLAWRRMVSAIIP